jgi:hypothetical protein
MLCRLVPVAARRTAGRMGRGLDERPAHVFGAIPGERPPVVSTSGLAEDRAQPGV